MPTIRMPANFRLRSPAFAGAVFLCVGLPATTMAQSSRPATTVAVRTEIDRRIDAVMPKVIEWRRDIHEHPELSGEEVRTSKLVADQLKALGLEVRAEVGGHGVVGVLRGGKPGPVVALRADMDALPVEEQLNLPFKSKARGMYRGQSVGIMHACGHDSHVAMLLGVATILSEMKAQVPGSVVFLFQPAEEGLPGGGGGAELMIKGGALDNPRVDAVFGLHVGPGPLGQANYRPGPMMAASNGYTIVVRGKQSHGAMPWTGVDPIVVGAQIVSSIQTIISRQVDITATPAIITVGAFQAGVRNNIIPDSVVMLGTIRAFDRGQRDEIFMRLKRTAEMIASSAGATARLVVDSGYTVTKNDTALTMRMLPTLQRAMGKAGVVPGPLQTTSEDFSYYQLKVPGLYFNLGVTPANKDWRTVPSNHSPLFEVDEAALPNGVRALASLAMDYLTGGK